ncbi:hypothetical protein HI113_44635, partial [Corallococcus exiguus]|uniref:hypothetical protein n=1 Tax=Corallococcus exiguus TaxID=83462 RepID=UPI0014757384
MTYEIWGTENNARENTAKSIYRDFIGSLPTGGYVVGWLEGSELFFQLYNAFGQKVGGPRPVPTGAGIGQSIASIEAVGTDGSFAIAWNENTG